jgi:HYR domain-containing protein/Big-like domain-containing protein
VKNEILSIATMIVLIVPSVLLVGLSGGFEAFAAKDAIRPSVHIESPSKNALLTAGTIDVTGIAYDKESKVKWVGVKVNRGVYTDAKPTDGKYSTWTAEIPITTPGYYRLTARVQDMSGNLYWDHVYVTVSSKVDKIPPSIDAPPDIATQATGALTSVSLGAPTVRDNSGIAPIVTKDAPTSFAIGTRQVKWTATDLSGNVATDQQLVTIYDWTRPTVKILSPLENTEISSIPKTLKVTGIASDIGSGVASVEVTARFPDLLMGQNYVLASSTDNWKTWNVDVTIANASYTRILARVTDNVGSVDWYDVQTDYTGVAPPPKPKPKPEPEPTPGVKEIYPTKAGGREWSMNMNNPTSDGIFSTGSTTGTKAIITKNADSSWRVSGKEYPESYRYQVRMIVGTPPGEEQWKNVEWTAYVKPIRTFGGQEWMENELYDAFILYARGGIHSSNDPCAGTAMKGGLELRGVTWFKKEIWHSGGYTNTAEVKSSVTPLLSDKDSNGHYFGGSKWIGFKLIMYNIDNESKVRMEIWLDKNANNDWEKVNEFTDTGSWYGDRSNFWDAGCKDVNGDLKQRNHVINYSGPWASIRTDYMEWDFKDLSVREIKTP